MEETRNPPQPPSREFNVQEDTIPTSIPPLPATLPPFHIALPAGPQPASQTIPTVLISKVKCHAKGCPGLHASPHTPLINCGADDCSRQVHRICYERMLKKSKKARTENPSIQFCTFACQDKYDKTSSTSHLHWRNDGKNGTDDPQHSEHYIVQWLSTGDNFAKWRSPSGGQTKIKIAEGVAKWLNTCELKREIAASMVYNKIMHIEGQMRSTYDWCSGFKTGIGLKESDPLSFNEKVSSVFLVFSLYNSTTLQPSNRHSVYLFRSKKSVHTTSTSKIYFWSVRE
jgi:hypothetical protein